MLITRDRSGLFSIQPSGSPAPNATNAHASVPEVGPAAPSMSHHLDLVRSGVASLEEELQQRASLLAVDNSNLRALLEQTQTELQTLKSRQYEYETMQKKLVKLQQQNLSSEKENSKLKQTLKFLQQELVKSGKKMPLDGANASAATPPPKPPPP